MNLEERGVETGDTQVLKKCAANWLQRADSAQWNEQDQAALEAWLSEASANRVAYWRVKSAWERARRLRVLQPAEIELDAPTRRRHRMPIWTAAIVIAIALFGAGASLLFSGPREQTFTTGLGGHRIVTLADGTAIELNTGTVLRAKVGAENREITLDRGEAYFSVTHDAKRPFVVVTGSGRVTDLGTKFFVRRDAASFEVGLLEGRARYDAANRANNGSFLLEPGDVIEDNGRSIGFAKKPTNTLADELGWRRGVLVFDRTTLADAAAEFNRYNSIKIVIVDPSIANTTIGGTFEAGKINVFAQLVHNLLGLNVVPRGDKIVISR
jgi:transmembrane sensor